MYSITKTLEIAGGHRLELDYKSKCGNLHGHNWIITIYCACLDEDLDKNGMVVDFTTIKNLIHDKLDHKYLNKVFDFNPTAENIAYWIYTQINSCYRVDVQESIGNVATYEEG